MKLKRKYEKKIINKFEEFIVSNYEKIKPKEMEMGKGLFNNRCHHNSVQSVLEGRADEVYLCYCISNKYYPVVHFINKVNGNFIDNTLGYEYKKYDYYIVKKIKESEFDGINDILSNKKKEIINLFSNPIICKLLNIDENNLGI